MTDAPKSITKGSVFLDLATVAYGDAPTPCDPVQAKARKGFRGLVAALRGLPDAEARKGEIDAVVKAAMCGDFEELQQFEGLEALLGLIPDGEYMTVLFDAGFQSPGEYHPRFIAAMEELEHIRKTEGEDAVHSEEHAHLFVTLHRYAPPSMQDEMLAMARSMGLIPAAEFVNERGEPVFTAEQIAAVHGIPLEEVEAHIAKLVADGVFDADHIGSGPVHRVQ